MNLWLKQSIIQKLKVRTHIQFVISTSLYIEINCEMDSLDDDFMMNTTVLNTSKTGLNAKKSDLKREKYTQKLKEKRNKSSRKQTSSFTNNPIMKSINSNLTEQKGFSLQKPVQRQNSQMKNQHKSQNRNSYRRKKLQIKPKGQSQRPLKKVYLNRQQQKGTIDLKNSKAEMEEVIEILPEKDLSKIQKLDKAPVEELHLNKHLLDSLKQNDINRLTQIQTMSYISVFKRKDTIIKAATGSGKTLAYLIPLINQALEHKYLAKRQEGTLMLVVCPTRQLCIQAQKQAMRCLKRLPFIVTGCLVGGQQTNHEKSRIRKGIPLLFSTPGRLLYHLQNTQCFKLQNIKTIIFEEADRTLDMGFQGTVDDILGILQKKLDFHNVQKILVSAHFNERVEGLVKNLLMGNSQYIGFDKKKPTLKQNQIEIDTQGMQITQKTDGMHEPVHEQEINTSTNLKQQYVLITQQQKIPFTLAYINVLSQSKIMIFVSTISQVEYMDYILNNMVYRNSNGLMTEEKIQKRRVFKIHGDLDQKLRTSTYFDFRKQKYAIMISTEVASRGLDFPDLSHIVLFDIPPTITDYGNRIGRSGRFNSVGVSLLLLHYQQSDYAEKIRYFNKEKPLQNINKDLIYESFEGFLKKLNIRDNSLHYLEGIVRSMVKDDDQKYQLARRAYVSMLRAYARLKQKHIFHVKKLNLKMMSRSFGLNGAQADRGYNPKAKQSHFQTLRKKRKVQNVKSLQVSQYL